MRTVFYVIFFISYIGLTACTATEELEPVQPDESEVVQVQPSPLVTETSASIVVSRELPTVNSADTTIDTDVPSTTPMLTTISETMTASVGLEPILVSTFDPDPNKQASIPENVWWSEDSRILYYQDAEAQLAWGFDLIKGISEVVPYIPRSFYELEPQIEATLPENARLFSLSPSYEKILYRIPLSEPIPFPEDPDNPAYPPYNYALWLRQDGQDTHLGLVDSCFGSIGPPNWSANENVAIVNTAGSPGYQCLHMSWLIDLETLSIGPLDTPWEGVQHYSVSDLSPDGNLLIVRAEINYFYNRETEEQWPIPGADTANIFFIETDPSPNCLVLEREFSTTYFQTQIWHCEPVTGKTSLFTTFETRIIDWVVSPDRRFIALIASNRNFLSEFEDLPTGVWVMALSLPS